MIPHNQPTLGSEEEKAALDTIRSGWIAQGTQVEKFENDFCNYLDIPKGHAIAVSSGSAALFLSLWVLNGQKKTILYPSYVCSALRNAVMMVGGNEKLLDNARNSPNINVNELMENFFDIKIIPHMYGIPIDLSNIKPNNVIEDCCQALGAKVNKKFVGLQGEIGFFSFHATKLMTSGGQGGMIISKNQELIESIKNFRDYGPQDKKFRFNFQMTDIQAAIGREQLKKLPYFLSSREKIFQKYVDAGLELLNIPESSINKLKPVRFRAIMFTKQPNEIIEKLAKNDIRATVLINESGLLDNSSSFPNAINFSKNTISLPIYPTLSLENVEKIISLINN
jgi:perosamine synthetase